MPVVPIRPQTAPPPQQAPTAPPDPRFLAMAAAQMHSEGRLIQKGSAPSGSERK